MHITDETRRALLAQRQALGPTGRGTRGVVEVATTVGPLHSTDPSTAFLQIAARADVGPAAIDQALYEDRVLLRHTTLRRTVHLLTPAAAVAAHGAYNHRMIPKLRSQLVAWIDAGSEVTEDAAVWLGALEEEVVRAVAELDRPSGTELSNRVEGLRTRVEPAPGKTYGKPIRITSKVLEILIAEGRIARDRPRGSDWTSGAWTYGNVEQWIPDGLGQPEPAASLVDLLRIRLGSLPGSSVTDLAWWTGLPKGQVTKALGVLGVRELVRDDGVIGLALPDDDLAVDGRGPEAALLPGLDATPMGCKERTWFLGQHESALFDRNGNIGPTVWWGGQVVGGWTQRESGEVVVGLLDPVDPAATAAINEEAARLQAWIGDVRVRWRYPTPLQKELEVG